MRKFRDLKIGTRLAIAFGSVIIVIITILGVWMYNVQKQNILDNADKQLANQLEDLVNIVDLQIKENQVKVNSGLKVASHLFYDQHDLFVKEDDFIELTAVNQITKRQLNKRVNKWYLNNTPIHNNYEFVDEIQKLTDATATIFQKIDEGYLRISTNVLNKDGSRATGTFIPNDSPVIRTIENGQTFKGRAFVVDDWYLTAYEPIKINGVVQGILYVGVKEKDLSKLKSIFEAKHFFNDGYPYMVSDEGTFIIHPTKEGENFSEAEFFQQIISSNAESGKTYYEWEDRMKYQYFEYYEPIKAYIVATLYEESLYNYMSDKISKTKITVLLAVLVSLVFVLAVVFTFTSYLNKAFKQVMELAEDVADGNLSKEINITNQDEIGKISTALNKMTVKLKEIIEGVREGADNIAAASLQMSSASQEVSQGASEQASSVEEISTSMEQMLSNIQQNTDNAQQTEKIASQAANGIEESNKSTGISVRAMKEIADKITIITDIAFQTNILALNAAVEAARAGEHGKGFAVVAAEVRKLAERSKVAADDIVQLSEKGVNVSEQAGRQLTEIMPNIENNARLVQEIAAASVEQSSGAGQVNSAVQQLNTVTQQNATVSEELATSAEELSGQAEQLKETISYFKFQSSKDINRNLEQAKTKLAKKQTDKKVEQKQYSGAKNNGGVDLKLYNNTVSDTEYESF